MIAPSYESELAAAGRALGQLLARPEFAEREDGPGQRKAKEDIINKLASDLGVSRERALTLIADAGQLRSAQGRKLTVTGKNNKPKHPEPDLAYNAQVNGRTQRVNIEVDSDPKTAVKHMQDLTKADPKARHVAVIVDPVSGKPTGGMVWDPAKGRARSLSPREIERWNRQDGPPKSVAPTPNRRQVNRAVPTRPSPPKQQTRAAMTAGLRTINPPRKRRGQKEMEFAAYELAAELGTGPERMDVDVPGIPGNNQFFSSAGEARRAALRDAQRAGLGHRIAHDPRPSRGQPHYHIVRPDGTRVSGHYFYGSRMPRRVLRGRPNREFEFEHEFAFAG